jgi:PIN domain nuclease of toxin-antitoxin system
VPETACVLDASVILAAMLGEMTPAEAELWLVGSCLSTVNLSEVVSKLVDRGYEADAIGQNLDALKLDVRPFDPAQAQRAGLLRGATRQFGLSLGDRACLALAAELDRPAVTADKAWAELEIGIRIELIR